MTEQPDYAPRDDQQRDEPIPKAYGLQMQERNPALVWLVWPILTIGIYSLVWVYKVTRELSEFDRRRSISPVTPVLVLIFLGWTIVAPLIIYSNMAGQIARAQRAAGIQVTCSQAAAVLLMFVFGAGVAYLQAEANKVTAQNPDAMPGEEVPLYA